MAGQKNESIPGPSTVGEEPVKGFRVGLPLLLITDHRRCPHREPDPEPFRSFNACLQRTILNIYYTTEVITHSHTVSGPLR